MREMMASDTAPAAAPGPNTPQTGTTSTVNAGTPNAPQGGLTGLLAPVQPARFTLDPDTPGDTPTAAEDDDTAGLSSADYHAPNPQDGTRTGAANGTAAGGHGKGQQGIWRAWMLAGAERWRKGADARNKALDLKKVRAQALQVKESRTVNRSEKLVSGSTNNGTSTQSNAGKSLNNKSSTASKGPGSSKNSPHSPKSGSGTRNGSGSGGHGGTGSGGGSGRGGAGNHGGRGTSGDHGHGKGTSSGKQTDHRKDQAKPSETGPGKFTGSHGGTGGSENRRSGKGSGDRNNGSSGKSRPNGAGGTGPQGSAGKDGKPGKDAPARTDTTKAKAADSKSKPGSGSTGTGTADGASGSGGSGKTDLKKKPTSLEKKPADGDGTKPGKTDGKKTAAADTSKTPGPKQQTGATTKTASRTGTGRPLNVQESREAGYRDGTRAATVAAHVGAWRDGVRDGWTDRQQDAAQERARLDRARNDRKTQQPDPAPVPQQKVPPMPTQSPTNQGPQPIQVLGVTPDGITLGTGADRTTLRHGEVRSLKDYERRLEAKADTLAHIAESTPGLKAHAEQQLKTVTTLLEQARVIEGGDQLLSALLKLQEAAQTQSAAADEVVTRAVRGHEACTVLIANVDARYGGIYKAVVDSGLIAPADLHYYEDSARAV